MSIDIDPDYEDDPDAGDPSGQPGGGKPPLSPAELRILKSKAKKWDDAEPKLTNLERENLLLKTEGLGKLDDIKRDALFAVHRGEMTPDALRTTAVALGYVEAPKSEIPDAERAAEERIIEASVGAGVPPPKADINADLQAAASEEEFWAKAKAAGVAT